MTNESMDEVYRPQYHFSAQTGWINDPNGLVFYKGRYHLFFQHNPFGTQWGNMTWGHAVSADLLHWRQLENALLPDKLGTMFSGSAVVDWNNTSGLQSGPETAIVVLYTAAGGTSEESKGQPFTQCLAYSTDAGDTLTKYEGNPVLQNVAKENRDPKVAWFAPGGYWVMALYLDGNTYALYSSSDLKAWEHLHNIEMQGCSECPDFFEAPIEGDEGERRWVLTAANGKYLVGRFDGRLFVPETVEPVQVDFGANYYAVQTYSDIPDGPASRRDGRRIQIAWMAGGAYPGMGFNQQMSFPCEMKLMRTVAGLRLTRQPVAEITTLYSTTRAWGDLLLTQPIVLSQHDLLDLTIECDVHPDAEVVLDIRGERLTFSAAQGALTCLGKTAPLAPVSGHVTLRVLVDRASIEVFGNGGLISMTSCFTPAPSASQTVLLGSGAKVTSLVVHELNTAWD